MGKKRCVSSELTVVNKFNLDGVNFIVGFDILKE